MKPIESVLKKYHIKTSQYELVNGDFAKLSPICKFPKKTSKLILVSAITPTASGEGKTSVAINLTDSLNAIKKPTIITLRQPSMGPVFGLKGKATGSGESIVCPEDAINMHFTGDLFAIEFANNLIASIIDNHIFHGNQLNIDPNKIIWKRCLDLNDRSLRNVEITLNKDIKYHTEFTITAASDLMTIFSLANSLSDFQKRLEAMIVAYDKKGHAICVKDLKITNAIMQVLKNAFNVNAALTKKGNLALIHGGAFANIAHGTNSIFALQSAMILASYTVTECGFGSDLGVEKFLDIVSRESKIIPNIIVLVVTIKSLIEHGKKTLPSETNKLKLIEAGFANAKAHFDNLKQFNMPFVVAINQFASDNESEMNLLKQLLTKQGCLFGIASPFQGVTKNSLALAKLIDLQLQKQLSIPKVQFVYDLKEKNDQKIKSITKRCYGISNIAFSPQAKKQLQNWNNLPCYICIAKTPLVFGDDPKIIDPNSQKITFEKFSFNAGANLLVAQTKNIFLIPGLPSHPIAHDMPTITKKI